MDIDGSKENIQPLRGGRNASQLGVALQAQMDTDHHNNLLLQRGEFEELIANYTGDDPLENWYNYISWIEQTYLSQGPEANLIKLLEHCLKLFEEDKRYQEDRRLCKLFIKYIDQQQNPLELYHMMYAQGLCRSCADMYKAWAYYYESGGNFQDAHRIFELGKRELAQPYDDLQIAHENLVVAAGQHIIYGTNDRDLSEKRQALTSLGTYKLGQVGNVRKPITPQEGTFVSGVPVTSRPNAAVPIYEDKGEEIRTTEVGPTSIITAAKRLEVPKENTLKPGPWISLPKQGSCMSVKAKQSMQKPRFKVHEDSEDLGGFEVNDLVKMTSENYGNWVVSITIPEPKDDRMIPMYPKTKVYSEIGTEYSLEELRSLRYRKEMEQVFSADVNEAASLFTEDTSTINNISDTAGMTEQIDQNYLHLDEQKLDSSTDNLTQVQTTNEIKENSPITEDWNTKSQQACSPDINSPKQCSGVVENFSVWNSFSNAKSSTSTDVVINAADKEQSPVTEDCTLNPRQAYSPDLNTSEEHCGTLANFDLWNSFSIKASNTSMNVVANPAVPKFSIYEQSDLVLQENIEPKGSAMKTPFKDLNAEELAETGSRGGMDVAAAAPVDSAKRLPLYDDDSGSSLEKNAEPPNFEDYTCNTQMFGFNLNVMQVSTPQTKQDNCNRFDADAGKVAAKQLFSETFSNENEKNDKVLSTILEETKSYGHSSSGSSSSATTNNLKQNNMATISEEHNNYLAQNLMVNAALRSSSLGDLMDFGHHSSRLPLPQKQPSFNCNRTIIIPPSPANIIPLNYVPSDPFKPALIKQLLERVCFPGPHIQGFCHLNNIPKLLVRKESVNIGCDKYIIEKQLGKGTYGTVFRGIDVKTGSTVAVKFQKPANRWEFYVCRELQARLVNHPLRERFMDVRLGYFSEQSSVLISEFMPCGSLLDVANTVKQKSGRSMKESLCIHFCLDMLKIVQAMHEVKIIHADIKPDNFLVQLFPNDTIGLQLIDFGCSIDMSLFPPDATFSRRVTTEDFVCCEMIDNRPWNYHTDLFCIAATAHVLLFEKYIQLQKREGLWSISNRLPRYARLDLWNMFFSTLLNQQDGPANSVSLQAMLEDSLHHKFDDYHNELRYLTNILKNR